MTVAADPTEYQPMANKPDPGRAARLNQAYKDSGLSIRECVERWGFNKNTIKSNINGNAPFGFHAAKRYAEVFGVSATWLYDGFDAGLVNVDDILVEIERVVDARILDADASQSYVASISAKGIEKATQKFGEEAVEVLVAALRETDDALISESADLVFHLIILLRLRGLSIKDVGAKLAQRQGVSGHAEKAARVKE